MFALDLNSPIVITVIGIATVVISALIGPLVVDKVRSGREKRKLRKGLYRELAKWYEQAFFYTKTHDHDSKNRFFEPATFDVRPEAPAESTNIVVGHSILDAEKNPRIGRDDLKWKLSDLQVIFDRLRNRLLTRNLYSSTLAKEEGLQLYYQIKESDAISRCYDPFRLHLTISLHPKMPCRLAGF
jgi:hypothetical protein